jgi:hypothetical protein
MATTKKAPVTPETQMAEAPRDLCVCGCGGFPKGVNSRFIPGHDARYHSAQKKAAAGEAAPPPSVAVNEPARPWRASRRSAGHDGTAGVDGNEA